MSLLSIILLSAAFLHCQVPAQKFFGSFSNPVKGPLPHDMKSQSQLNKLYNQPVIKTELLKRPLSNSGIAVGPLSHSGVRATLDDGKQLLIHKGNGFGKSSDTVVVDAKHMSNKWQVKDSKPVQGKTVGDLVKAGGKDYNLLHDNCHHAAKRIMNKKE